MVVLSDVSSRKDERVSYDVIVIGAGPAGSTAARDLALCGKRVLLIDKAVFPRIRPCGGVVSEKALSALDFPLPQTLVEREIFGVKVHYKGRETSARKPYRLAVVTSRIDFDHFLLNRAVEAGADFLPNTKASKFEQDAARATVHTEGGTYSARFVVGADGPTSIVARSLWPGLVGVNLSVTHEYDVPHGDLSAGSTEDQYVNVHFSGVDGKSYGWVLPHRGFWNVGIWGLASQIRNAREAHATFSSTLSLPSVLAGTEPRNRLSWIIPGGGSADRLGRGRALLVGDAAGFTDFFFGEGIPYAIRSGKIAASLLAMDRELEEIQRLYRRRCGREILRDLKWSRRMGAALHRYPDLLLKVFSTNRSILERYLDVGAGYSSYRQFLTWLVPRLPGFLAGALVGGEQDRIRTEGRV